MNILSQNSSGERRQTPNVRRLSKDAIEIFLGVRVSNYQAAENLKNIVRSVVAPENFVSAPVVDAQIIGDEVVGTQTPLTPSQEQMARDLIHNAFNLAGANE